MRRLPSKDQGTQGEDCQEESWAGVPWLSWLTVVPWIQQRWFGIHGLRNKIYSAPIIGLVRVRVSWEELCVVKMGENYQCSFTETYGIFLKSLQALCACTSGMIKQFEVKGCERPATARTIKDRSEATWFGKRHVINSLMNTNYFFPEWF